MDVIPDGAYDVLVIDVEDRSDGRRYFEIAVLSGDRKGLVASVSTRADDEDPAALLGLPGTLYVRRAVPDLRIERGDG